MNRRRGDQTAIGRGPGIGFVEIERMVFTDRPTIKLDRFLGKRVGQRLSRFTGNDVVPYFPQIGVLPEIGFEGLRLRHRCLSPYCSPGELYRRFMNNMPGRCGGWGNSRWPRTSDGFVRAIARGFAVV